MNKVTDVINKTCATLLSHFISMTYKERPVQTPPSAEPVIPPGSRLIPSSWRWGWLGLFCYPLLGHTASPSLSELLEQDAHERIQQFLVSRGWPTGQSNIQVRLPAAETQLPPCQRPVNMDLTSQPQQPWGRHHYRLHCAQPVWELSARVDIQLWLPVQTARHHMAKEHTVTLSDLQPVEMDVSRLRRAFTPLASDLVGRLTQRTIRQGHIMQASQLANPPVINKGDTVLIRASQPGFAVSMRGEALASGGIGDSIRVKNISSGRLIQAVVVETGVVETRF